MERQAETANRLGYVLEQQTKIMEEQLTLHSRIEAKMERERIFDAVLGLQAKVADLTAELSPPPQMLTATEEQQRISDKWIRLEDAIPPCLTGLITATHLSPEEKDYCIHFALDLDAITKMRSVNTPQMNINGLRAISQTYNDLATKLDQSVHR